jgi:hypothetical protein
MVLELDLGLNPEQLKIACKDTALNSERRELLTFAKDPCSDDFLRRYPASDASSHPLFTWLIRNLTGGWDHPESPDICTPLCFELYAESHPSPVVQRAGGYETRSYEWPTKIRYLNLRLEIIQDEAGNQWERWALRGTKDHP